VCYGCTGYDIYNWRQNTKLVTIFYPEVLGHGLYDNFVSAAGAIWLTNNARGRLRTYRTKRLGPRHDSCVVTE
jgi:hypothetical protein